VLNGVKNAKTLAAAQSDAASTSALLLMAVDAANAWLAANPTPAPAPPPVPVATGPIFGINEHFLMWTDAADYPIAAMKTLGVKVCRCDLYGDGTTSDYTGTLASAETIATVQGYAADLRAAGIQPMIVVTFKSQPPTAMFASEMATLVAACPGIWWEIGNELDGAGLNAAAYVPFFAAAVTAMHAADPTCKVAPAPVSNINVEGSGWNWDYTAFAAGLGAVDYDFFFFHNYPWTPNISPTTPWAGGKDAEQLIPQFTAQATAWGNKAPCGLSEWGWESPGEKYPLTAALQSSYCVAFWQSAEVQALAVAIAYELGDGGGQTYGWMTADWVTPKLVYTAFEGAA
jgi:hypothetical protein